MAKEHFPTREDTIIETTLALANIVSALETDFSYLSEETDRWNSAWNWHKQHRAFQRGEETTETLIVAHVIEFRQLQQRIVDLRIRANSAIADLLFRGQACSEGIQHGQFVSHSKMLAELSRVHGE